MVFEINYQKNNNETLFNSLEKFLKLENPQNYIPIYNKYFQLNETNYNNINLNNNFSLNEIIEELSDSNSFKCSLKNLKDETISFKNVFFKFSPLLDPVKYMIGKYDTSDENLLNIPDFMNKKGHAKVLDNNNAAYVDGFFTYLTSQMLNHHGFINGLDYYGSFLGMKNNFLVNVYDDLEYLYDSEFFNTHKNELFKIDSEYQNDLLNFDSKKNKKRLVIKNDEKDGNNENNANGENVSNNNILTLDDIESLDDINTLFHVSKDQNEDLMVVEESDLLFENEVSMSKINSKVDTKGSNSTCSSRTSNTDGNSLDDENGKEDSDNEDDEDDEDDEDEEDEEGESVSECSTASEDVINAIINKFPVNVICLEKCLKTLDDLITSTELSTKEWCAILMQVIMILLTYQKTFNFTHNDLHTNNIMYIQTDKEFLYYKFNNKHYKVPTCGRIFKIIDFGRAIYKFKGVTVCSDSFHKNGDAATQYNFEPYMNEKKPRLEPNYSFDLCRLACSLYDFLIPDDEDINKTPITRLINEWCKDDKGRNVLYKTNGEERYPDFKLYKMIVRTVHEHTPENQLKRELFSQFLVARNKLSKIKKIINIDDMPVYS